MKFSFSIFFLIISQYRFQHNLWNIQELKARLKPTHQGISNTKLNIKSVKANLSKFDVIVYKRLGQKMTP